MPGLYGLIDQKAEIKKQLNSMGAALRSDWTKIDEDWVDPSDGIGLGRVDLGIFQADQQPLKKNGRVLFVIGEIVNQEELMTMISFPATQADASVKELILTLYEQKGVEAFGLLNGSYAIAIWEIAEKRLTLACDYAGLRPLFYYHSGNRFCFASEIKALLALNWFPRQVEKKAVIDLLGFGFPKAELTLFEKITRLRPGMILIYQNGQLEIKQGFQVRFSPQPSTLNLQEHTENVSHLLDRALLARCRSGSKTGLTLSGGIDTRVLLAACSHLNLKVPTFTYGLNHSRDRKWAKKLSEIAGFTHYAFPLKSDHIKENASVVLERCEGRVDCFQSHGLLLLEMKNWVDIMLLGNGGEYLFSTVSDYYPESPENATDDPYEKYYHFRNSFFKEEDWPKLFRENLQKLKDYPREKLFETLHFYDPLHADQAIDAYWFNDVQMYRTLQGLYMVNHVMEFSEPYFDRDLILYAVSLPLPFRRKRLIQNALLEKYNKKMAFVEGGHLYQQTRVQRFVQKSVTRTVRRLVRYKILDKKMIAKPSSTFSDLHQSIRYPSNRNWIESVLLNNAAKIYEFVHPAYVQDVVKQHMNADTNFTKQINTLMTLELFLQEYM